MSCLEGADLHAQLRATPPDQRPLARRHVIAQFKPVAFEAHFAVTTLAAGPVQRIVRKRDSRTIHARTAESIQQNLSHLQDVGSGDIIAFVQVQTMLNGRPAPERAFGLVPEEHTGLIPGCPEHSAAEHVAKEAAESPTRLGNRIQLHLQVPVTGIPVCAKDLSVPAEAVEHRGRYRKGVTSSLKPGLEQVCQPERNAMRLKVRKQPQSAGDVQISRPVVVDGLGQCSGETQRPVIGLQLLIPNLILPVTDGILMEQIGGVLNQQGQPRLTLSRGE